MTKDESTIIEQHISTIIGVVVVGLLSWLLISVNQLQITMAELANEMSHINNKLNNAVNDSKQYDRRIDSLERWRDMVEARKNSDK